MTASVALERLPVELRALTLDDLPQVMALEVRAFKHPWTVDLFRSELNNSWSTILLAEHLDGSARRLVGFIVFWVVHDEVHVLNVASDPDLRGRGIARTLLDECVSRARAARAVLLTLEVRRSNANALRLYERYGFRRVGVRPKYYADENEDAIVMQLDLPPGAP